MSTPTTQGDGGMSDEGVNTVTVFGTAIRDVRRALGLTQRELADKIGVSFTYISKIENNRIEIPPSEKTIRAIAEVLEIDAATLLMGSGRMADVTYAEWANMQAEIRRLRAENKFLEESIAYLRTSSQDTPDLWLEQQIIIGSHLYKIVTIDARNKDVGALITAVRID